MHQSGASDHFIHMHSGSVGAFSSFVMEALTRPIRGGDWGKRVLEDLEDTRRFEHEK